MFSNLGFTHLPVKHVNILVKFTVLVPLVVTRKAPHLTHLAKDAVVVNVVVHRADQRQAGTPLGVGQSSVPRPASTQGFRIGVLCPKNTQGFRIGVFKTTPRVLGFVDGSRDLISRPPTPRLYLSLGF